MVPMVPSLFKSQSASGKQMFLVLCTEAILVELINKYIFHELLSINQNLKSALYVFVSLYQ